MQKPPEWKDKMNRLQHLMEENGSGPVLGAATYFYDPLFLDVAGYLGFRAIWIEMEHGHITFKEAADLCRMAAGHGMLSMVRIPDARRENVLKACECGPDIIDVPMADTAEVFQELARWARFPPEGERGTFTVSRAVNYGLTGSVADEQQRINQELCLMGQVETETAVRNIDQLCTVPGVDIFIGPADLASSLGVPGQTGHPKVQAAAKHVIERARAHGKLVAVGAAHHDAKFWIENNVDLMFCANDTTCLKLGAQTILKVVQDAIVQVEEARETA